MTATAYNGYQKTFNKPRWQFTQKTVCLGFLQANRAHIFIKALQLIINWNIQELMAKPTPFTAGAVS